MNEWIYVALFIVVGLIIPIGAIGAGFVFGPKKPNPVKESTYECGEPAIGSAWVRFDMRFYTVALIFVVFDVELAFLFPWAVVFKEMGGVALVEGVIFIAILFLGLVYVWAKGDLDWVKSFAAQKDAIEKKLAAGEKRAA